MCRVMLLVDLVFTLLRLASEISKLLVINFFEFCCKAIIMLCLRISDHNEDVGQAHQVHLAQLLHTHTRRIVLRHTVDHVAAAAALRIALPTIILALSVAPLALPLQEMILLLFHARVKGRPLIDEYHYCLMTGYWNTIIVSNHDMLRMYLHLLLSTIV